jgi:hypothetical protein
MPSVVRRPRGQSLTWLLLSLFAVTVFPGCNKTTERTDEREQVNNLPNKIPVAKFAGHVSVDGQPPPEQATLFVILNDPQHPKPGGKAYTICDPQGNFAFSTYLEGDGAPTGKYVVSFVVFHQGGGATNGRGSTMGRLPGLFAVEYVGPDGLKNLYNDPEKNKDDPKFLAEIASPGRTDYDFNLEVAGKEPVRTPGPYAATKLRTDITPKL